MQLSTESLIFKRELSILGMIGSSPVSPFGLVARSASTLQVQAEWSEKKRLGMTPMRRIDYQHAG
jgi:hypothetical protein